MLYISGMSLTQWRIQDFPEVGAPTLHGVPTYDFAKFSQKNCMKLKEFGPRGCEGRAPPFSYTHTERQVARQA